MHPGTAGRHETERGARSHADTCRETASCARPAPGQASRLSAPRAEFLWACSSVPMTTSKRRFILSTGLLLVWRIAVPLAQGGNPDALYRDREHPQSASRAADLW